MQQTTLSFKVYHKMPFLSTVVASRLQTNAILVVVVVVVVVVVSPPGRSSVPSPSHVVALW